ncbi:MAG: DUF3795 domain-containing protein [Thermoplasmata archaeon]
MDRIIGFCGLVCTDCPAYLATQKNDEKLRKETAAKWSEMYHSDIKPDAINCDGCTTPGKKFHHCTECEMRLCGLAKGVKNCGHCTDYACDKLVAFFKYVPDAKDVLDAEKRASG